MKRTLSNPAQREEERTRTPPGMRIQGTPPPQTPVISDSVSNFIVELAAIRPSVEHPVGTEAEVDTNKQTPSVQADVQMVEPVQPTESDQIASYQAAIEWLINEIQKHEPTYRERKLPAALKGLVELYYELSAYLSHLQEKNASASVYQSGNVEPAEPTEENLIDWTRYCISEIQKYDPEYERKIPTTLEELKQLYNESSSYLYNLQANAATYQSETVEGIPYEGINTTSSNNIPAATGGHSEIYTKLKGMGCFVVGDRKGKQKKSDLTPEGVNCDESRKLVRGIAESYAIGGSKNDAYELVGLWNAYAPEYGLTRKEVGLPDDFLPSQSVTTAPQTRAFTLKGQTFNLKERDGVAGGCHSLYDAPNIYDGRALVRAPKTKKNGPDAGTLASQGMANLASVEKLGFGVPKIYNKPAEDGFYVVEYIPGQFNPSNKKHREQVTKAFAGMLAKGNKFPFDFRIDNVKFKGDTMVVIDFSEGGEGAGDVSFWKDSLIEFCWKKTKSRVDGRATSGSNILDQLIADAKVADVEMGSRLPSSLGQSPGDYDGGLLDDIWKGLPNDAKQKILNSLH